MTHLSDAKISRRDRQTSILAYGWHWARIHLFSSWMNAALTLSAIALLWLTIPALIDWLIISASWTGESRDACLNENQGACWPFIFEKWEQFIYGRYPQEEIWRVNLVFLLAFGGALPMLIPAVPWKGWNALFLVVIFPILCLYLLSGGVMGLPYVESSRWGGLLVTLVIAGVGNAAALPLGILLALGRRSEMRILRTLCVLFIEFWRGIPLITVLFMASVMLPLFFAEGASFDKLLRCLIGVALFSSAYMAEVVRGGLQAIPQGQHDAARALGMGYWRMTILIILPQALKIVIPGIVNSFIALFKDTTLVLIVGLFDLLGIIQLHLADPTWATPQTHYTGYAFAALLFWLFCFGMSRYSQYMERRLGTEPSHNG